MHNIMERLDLAHPRRNLMSYLILVDPTSRFHHQKCYFSLACYTHRWYKSKKSKTYTKSGTSCKTRYVSGSISGFFSQDNVKVGNVVVKNQDFIEATREGCLSFVLAKFDGLRGLGFQDISVENAVPVWYNMVQENLASEQVFKGLTEKFRSK
ncbi:Aspartic proteinase oryzasin-1 [Spatholobus suberectus]|nr:Aspartic proteinase oryzasin-1 [Spatholobus suberectus]